MGERPENRADARQLEQLLAQMALGNADALAEFYQHTRRAAYALALSLMQNPQDAEDVLQDAYLRAWTMAGQYRVGAVPGRPVGWLLTILRNLAYSKLRSQKRAVPLSTEDLDLFFADRPTVSSEDRLVLNAALLALSDEERQIVLLHAAGGLKHREIAQLLGLTLSTVLSKYHRALKKLKNHWEEC